MTNVPSTHASPTTRQSRHTDLALAAALATLLWLEVIAFGIPKIAGARTGYTLIPVVALAGAAVGLTTARRFLLPLVFALAIPLAIVAFTPIMRWPARALTRSDPVGARPIHAIVVLSGGINDDNYLRPPAADRLLTALSLIRRGVATTLIVTRERGGPLGARTSDVDQQRLVSLLERPIRLLIVDSIYSTRDEAVRTHALARTLDITSIAVVTSPLHTYRACATFEKVGFLVTCVPSESRDVALGAMRGPADRVTVLQLCLYELAGLARYAVSRWT